eukprot:122349-Chlamydomonas_euryale.AAC.2
MYGFVCVHPPKPPHLSFPPPHRTAPHRTAPHRTAPHSPASHHKQRPAAHLVDRVVCVHGAVHAKHVEVLLVRRRHHADAHERRRARDARLVNKLAKLVRRVDAAATKVEHRLRGAPKGGGWMNEVWKFMHILCRFGAAVAEDQHWLRGGHDRAGGYRGQDDLRTGSCMAGTSMG